MVMHQKMIVFCVVLFPQLSAAANLFSDWTIQPGVRIGPITKTTAYDQLVKTFGKKNITKGEASSDESESEFESNGSAELVIFAGQPEREITLYYKGDPANKSTFKITGGYLSVHFENAVKQPIRSQWKVEPGLTLGTSLKEVERINGKPFGIYGFEWDWGGEVTNWSDGKLKNSGNIRIVRFSVVGKRSDDKDYRSVVGHETFDSSNKVIQKLNPIISYLSFDL